MPAKDLSACGDPEREYEKHSSSVQRLMFQPRDIVRPKTFRDLFCIGQTFFPHAAKGD